MDAGSSSNSGVSSPAAEQVAAPTRPRIRKQFSLATLLIFVLGSAGGINVWMYWQPWATVGEFENCRDVGFSADSSKLTLVSQHPAEIDVSSGAAVGSPSFKAAWSVVLSPNRDRAACY